MKYAYLFILLGIVSYSCQGNEGSDICLVNRYFIRNNSDVNLKVDFLANDWLISGPIDSVFQIPVDTDVKLAENCCLSPPDAAGTFIEIRFFDAEDDGENPLAIISPVENSSWIEIDDDNKDGCWIRSYAIVMTNEDLN